VFCSSCGTEQAEDSRFCRKCGRTLAAGARTKRKSYVGRIVIAILALILVVFAIPTVSRLMQASGPVHQLIAQRRTVQLGSTTFAVKNLGYVYTQFAVPPGATNVSVTGRFTASGGLGNDIEAYILTSDGFVNFQNGHQATTYYQSGRVTQGSINANLPAGATYYLVFNNNFSLLSAKAVQASVTLNYTE
jgi:predicted nucleic acid-binding Zn ribbon protein